MIIPEIIPQATRALEGVPQMQCIKLVHQVNILIIHASWFPISG
jgi:hypothetical protein